MTLTTNTITAESASKRSAQSTTKSPERIQVASRIVRGSPPRATSMNSQTDSTAASAIRLQVKISAQRWPSLGPRKKAPMKPASGRKTARISIIARV